MVRALPATGLIDAWHVDATRNWSPALAVRVSMGLHALAAAGAIASPAEWAWMLGGVAANQMLLAASGMWPHSRLLGPNITHLPEASIRRGEVTLSFDDGPDPSVTPAVLDLLDRHAARASFFCIGERAAAHPDLVREIARRGHGVENHSATHPRAFACYPPGLLERELTQAQETIEGIIGRAPRLFRPPMGLRSPLLDPVLHRLRLRQITWTRRGYDAVIGDPNKVLRRLTRGLAAGDVLLMHDGNCARTRLGRPIVLEILPALLNRMAAEGLRSVSLSGALAG